VRALSPVPFCLELESNFLSMAEIEHSSQHELQYLSVLRNEVDTFDSISFDKSEQPSPFRLVFCIVLVAPC